MGWTQTFEHHCTCIRSQDLVRSQDLSVVKIFSRNLFACLQEETSSFRRLRLATFGLQIIKYFSQRHKLHLIDTVL